MITIRFATISFAVLLQWGFTYAQLPARGSLAVKLPSTLFFNELIGKPFASSDYSDISGSPFINKDWRNCTIKLNDGRYFGDVPVKVNILNQSLHYKPIGGGEREVSKGIITEVQMPDTSANAVITTRLFRTGFSSIDKNDEHTFYEILDSGKVELLLWRAVKVTETKIIGVGTEKEYQSSQDYYINLDSNLVKCKKSSSFFIELFADKKDQVKKYIDENNLKCKSEKDFGRIVRFYNSL
jgi:hypothetical protein